jgi:hypothetical protein
VTLEEAQELASVRIQPVLTWAAKAIGITPASSAA